ncbi:hypothetical protein V757_11215 [Pelistega indica]|uniref:Uncharacterized protein n=1 Tax=Pelistega indica TaxID=1414851 RepID=V8FUK5_9BURK|nr:hypothetical protein [Pelistega indica]ETD67551.1 hypothetical protein V757_11215 [Pelistega indica]
MTTVSFDEFKHEIRLAIGEAPDDLIANYVRLAIIELCERSQVLARTIEIDLQCGVEEYYIETEEDERIVSIQRICVDGNCCSDNAILRASEPCDTGCTVHSRAIWFVPPDTLNIRPVPTSNKEGAVKVFVAVAPTREACSVDQLIYERYFDTVINGALARLYLAKTTPWHDRGLAEYHRQLFDKGVAVAGMDRQTGHMRGRIKMTPRRII